MNSKTIDMLKENRRKLARKQQRLSDWEKYGNLFLHDIEVEMEDIAS